MTALRKRNFSWNAVPSLNPSFLFPTNTLSFSASGSCSCESLLITSSIHTSLLSHSQIIILVVSVVDSRGVPVSLIHALFSSITHIPYHHLHSCHLCEQFIMTGNSIPSIQYCSQRLQWFRAILDPITIKVFFQYISGSTWFPVSVILIMIKQQSVVPHTRCSFPGSTNHCRFIVGWWTQPFFGSECDFWILTQYLRRYINQFKIVMPVFGINTKPFVVTDYHDPIKYDTLYIVLFIPLVLISISTD